MTGLDDIRALLARYAVLADRGKVADIAMLFLEEGVLEVEGVRHEGRTAIAAAFQAVAERFSAHGDAARSLRHHLTTLDVRPTGQGTAAVTAYVVVIGSHGLDHWGHYRDTVVHTEGGWRFADRRAVVDGCLPGSVAESPLLR